MIEMVAQGLVDLEWLHAKLIEFNGPPAFIHDIMDQITYTRTELERMKADGR